MREIQDDNLATIINDKIRKIFAIKAIQSLKFLSVSFQQFGLGKMKVFSIISLIAVTTWALPQSPRIWNGNIAQPHAAPYMIGILWYEEATTIQPVNICGGAIVNVWWVITAAHCLVNNLTGIGRFQIVVGQHFVSIANRSGREQFREISLEILHPQFNGGASNYDIAMIRLENPLQFNAFVQPIELPVQSNIIPQAGTITSFGWGSTTGQAPHQGSDVLRTTSVPIMANNLCREVFSVIFPGNPVSTSCICTGIFSGSGNVCNADSGGPAVMTNSSGGLTLVGVLAWGMPPCFNPDIPTVWSAIAPARNWIETSMSANPPPS